MTPPALTRCLQRGSGLGQGARGTLPAGQAWEGAQHGYLHRQAGTDVVAGMARAHACANSTCSQARVEQTTLQAHTCVHTHAHTCACTHTHTWSRPPGTGDGTGALLPLPSPSRAATSALRPRLLTSRILPQPGHRPAQQGLGLTGSTVARMGLPSCCPAGKVAPTWHREPQGSAPAPSSPPLCRCRHRQCLHQTNSWQLWQRPAH